MHPRFSSVVDQEPPPSLALRQRRAAERAKTYDKAYQRSTLLASSTLPGRRNNAGRGGGTFGGGRIEEESRLDGESFVAPTEEMPFGLVDSFEQRNEEGGGGGEDEGETRLNGNGNRSMPGNNLGALVGELYRR
jgi:hypothetical protein